MRVARGCSWLADRAGQLLVGETANVAPRDGATRAIGFGRWDGLGTGSAHHPGFAREGPSASNGRGGIMLHNPGAVASVVDEGGARAAPSDAVTVIVISDVLLHREGVAAALSARPPLRVLATGGAGDAVRLARAHAPGAILIDVPGPAALAQVPALKAAAPDAALVGFGVGDDQLGLACAEAGLTGFVDRDGTLCDLVDAVRRARAGELGCSPQLAALMCRRLAVLAGRPASGSLSPREREVARLVADGLSNKEIAQKLAIGPATVKNHVHNILDKMALRRRSAIAGRLPML